MTTYFMSHPKVKEAKKLLREAECEIRTSLKKEQMNIICACGHERKFHGPTHSINYTGGICDKCECLNYLQKDKYGKS